MDLSGDLQDRTDVQTLNHWMANWEPPELSRKIVLDASLPPHGFQVIGPKLYLGVAAYQYLQRFLAGRGVKIESTYLVGTGA